MLIYDSILSSPIKRNLLRQHRLQETLPSSLTRFQPSFRSPMSATLPCPSERTWILRKSLRMSNWIVCDATGGFASAPSLPHITIYFLCLHLSLPPPDHALLRF